LYLVLGMWFCNEGSIAGLFGSTPLADRQANEGGGALADFSFKHGRAFLAFDERAMDDRQALAGTITPTSSRSTCGATCIRA
jgi:hypothetical protein